MRYARMPVIIGTSSLLLLSLLGTAAPPARPASSTPVPPSSHTTLQRTIVPQGDRNLGYGPGQEPVTRAMGWGHRWGKGRPLAGFKQISDVHVIDEESPARVEFLDQCGTPFTSAYRVQEAMSLQVGNSMLKRLRRIKTGPRTGMPLRFYVSTGDNIDNNQLNEQRWFIRLLDGDRVNPNSGGPGYHGYTREQFDQALPDRILRLAQKSFDPVGAELPWYAILGNHDGLVQGNVYKNDVFNSFAVGGVKPFKPLNEAQSCPTGPEDAVGTLAALTGAAETHSRPVPADPRRHLMDQEELVRQFFKTSGRPDGHGLARSPSDPLRGGARAGYYSFPIGRRVLGISLDTISYDGGPNGHITGPQWRWLVRKLKANSRYWLLNGKRRAHPEGRNRLIVLFSHHSSLSLDNPGGNAGAAPYHCFERTDNPACAEGQGLHELLLRFPNVIGWVNGHEHNNRVAPYPAPEGRDPALGFWEINTAAHIDWPEQARVIEIAWKPGRTRRAADTVFIYGTTVDHIAPPDPNSRTQSRTGFLSSISRVEAYYDACVRERQAECDALGRRGDRNVKLVQKAPFNLGHR